MIAGMGPIRRLGVDSQQAPLRFGEGPKPEGAWAGRRLLWLADQPAFELSMWCGTCPALFQRLEGANETASLPELAERLTTGVDSLDETVIARFGELLPAGDYLPMLLEVQPRLTYPIDADDYFAHEQVDTWGIDGFWGLPEHPRTPYYRTFETAVDSDAHMYEFVVPMVPPTWNDPARVQRYEQILGISSAPTAVAVSTLDICQPATANKGSDYYAHWVTTHFLLDGHHKVQAAAAIRRPLRLLSLLDVNASLATPVDIQRLPQVRARQQARRGTPPAG